MNPPDPDSAPPADNERGLSGLWLRLFFTVMGLAVLYVLSIGPASVVNMRIKPRQDVWFHSFYSPLFFIAEDTGTQPALERYARWWIFTFQPKEGYSVFGKRIRIDAHGNPAPVTVPAAPEGGAGGR